MSAFGSAPFGTQWLVRNVDASEPGEIVTFYSYKGGTGRTMALVNCAGLVASCWPRSANPLLLWDFDLEAPGIHHYLDPFLPRGPNLASAPGTLELFEELAASVAREFASPLSHASAKSRLDDEACSAIVASLDLSKFLIESALDRTFLIKAGRFDETYAERLSSFDWKRLFLSAPGIFRAIAGRLARDFGYTFIDARTGMTDTSGICTALLPDVLVVVFTANKQSLAGVRKAVTDAVGYRAKSADLRPLRIYPLPSRMEQASEDYRLAWQKGATNHRIFGDVVGYQPMFAELFADLDQACTWPSAAQDDKPGDLGRYFDRVVVPHSADYSYGERLSFVPEASTDRLSLRTAFEAFLPWLVTGAAPWQEPEVQVRDMRLRRELSNVAPPAGDSADSWFAWFRSLSEGLAPLRALCGIALAPPEEDSSPLAPDLIPQVATALAIAAAERKEWGEAGRWLRWAMPSVRAVGLPGDWEPCLLRWAELNRNVQGKDALAEWISTEWLDDVDQWMRSMEPSKRVRSHWLMCAARIAQDAGLMVRAEKGWREAIDECERSFGPLSEEAEASRSGLHSIEQSRALPYAPQPSRLNPSLTFATFVPGKANQMARTAALHVAGAPGQRYNPLFIYGGVGLGKTHLIHAAGNALLADRPDRRILYLHAEQFITDVVKSYQRKTFDELKAKYHSLDLLLIDDVQFFAGKERSQEEFYNTFEALLGKHAQIIMTCDTYPKGLVDIDARVTSRFEAGLTVALEPPDFEMRVAILMAKARADGVELPEEVAFFIAKNVRSNVRELEGALRKVMAYSRFSQKEINLSLAQAALKDLLDIQNRQLSIENIQKTVAHFYKIKVDDMCSRKRSDAVARPRQVAMYLAKELTQKSLPEIGELFGGRGHTSALNAVRKIATERQANRELNHQLHVLEQTLKG